MSIAEKNLVFVMGSVTTGSGLTEVVNDIVILKDGSTGYYFKSDLTSPATSPDTLTGITTFTAITNNDGSADDEEPGASDSYNALTLGGSSSTLTVPWQVIKHLADDGLNFSDTADTTGFFDVKIADGTSIKITHDGDFFDIEGAAFYAGNIKSALDSLLASGASFGTIKVIPGDEDPGGAIATAITSVIDDLNDYYNGTASTDPTITAATATLVTELAKAVASSKDATAPINVLDAVLTGSNAPSGLTLYTLLDRTGASDTTGLFYHRDHDTWVEVITAADMAGIATALLNDAKDALKTDYTVLEVGTFDDHEYNENGTVKADGSDNLLARLTADGLIGVGKSAQTGSVLDDYNAVVSLTNELSSEAIFEATASDLDIILNDLEFNSEQFDASNRAVESWFEIDVTNQNAFWFDASSSATLNGVQFSGDIQLNIYDLPSDYKIDMKGNDFTSSTKITIDTYDEGYGGQVKLSGYLDADVDVVVMGNRSLDITHLDSTMPTSWFVNEGADLKLLNSQYEAIKAGGTAGTDYDFDGTLHIYGNNSSTAETITGTAASDFIHGDAGTNTINGKGGNDTLFGNEGADTFQVDHGSGHDRIYGFNFDRDTLAFGNDSDSTYANHTFDTTFFTGATRDNEGNIVIENPNDSNTKVTLVAPVNSNPLTVSEVAGERWGDYVTFKVTSADFASLEALDFKLSWDTTEFVYVNGSLDTSNSFIPSDLAPGTTSSDLDTNGLTGSGVITLDDTANGEISLSMLETTPIAVNSTNGNEAFKFMLKRIDPNPNENNIGFDYVSSRENGASEKVSAGGKFGFDYRFDNVTAKVKTHSNIIAPNPEVIVANGNVQDGLSIVPIATHGQFTQYEVVFNLSYPTTYLNNALESSYNMQIDGSIVAGSVTGAMNGDLFTELTGGAIVPGDVTVTGAATTLSSDDYVDTWDAILGIATAGGVASKTVNVDSRGLDFTLTPGVTSGVNTFILDNPTTSSIDEGLTEGRYSLATFIAANNTGTPIEITTEDAGTSSTIKLLNQNVSASELYASSGKTFSIADGSEIFILGDKWYDNPETYTRAVTSSDALDALNISSGSKTDATNAQIIAADVNKDGKVSAMDAYSILQYAANSNTNMADFSPEWFYIDDLSSLKDSAEGATKLDYTDFSFDYEVDQFVGTTDTITVTGVLLGDVTGSYSALENYLDPLSGIHNINLNDVNPNAGSQSNSGAASGSWAADTTVSFDGTTAETLSGSSKDLLKVNTSGLSDLTSEPKLITGFDADQDRIELPLSLVESGDQPRFAYFSTVSMETDASDFSAFKAELENYVGTYLSGNPSQLSSSDPGIRVVGIEIKDTDGNAGYSEPGHVLVLEGTDDNNGADGFLFFDIVSNWGNFRTDDLTIEVSGSNVGGTTVTVGVSDETVSANMGKEIFNLPTSTTTVETISFGSPGHATGDIINNFDADNDVISLTISGATGGVKLIHSSILTANTSSISDITSAFMAANISSSGLSSGEVGAVVLDIADIDGNGNSGQIVAIDQHTSGGQVGIQSDDYFIAFASGTFTSGDLSSFDMFTVA